MEIKKVYITEKNYPPLLREIQNPPDPLYYAGNLRAAHERCVAVVGSRKTTQYGRWAAETMGNRLSGCGVTVVSGMAKGIDTCAHWGALKSSGIGKTGSTIAVLGCGIDVCYPAENRQLRDEILERGLILSQYPPGTAPAKYRFPQRNRIISGLSEVVVVIQAPDSSGALITAEMAADQGRTVYAVPGNINSAYHMGSNKLIRDGAVPLVVLDDLLDDLGLARDVAEAEEKQLGMDEKMILSCLKEQGEMTAEQLCRISGFTAAKVMGLVTILEIKGVICTSLGKIFIAK